MPDEELELNLEQLTRIDDIHNAVWKLCAVLTEDENLRWDMSYIGEIADLAAEVLVRDGHRVRYPAIVEDEDGTQHIEDYVEG